MFRIRHSFPLGLILLVFSKYSTHHTKFIEKKKCEIHMEGARRSPAVSCAQPACPIPTVGWLGLEGSLPGLIN